MPISLLSARETESEGDVAFKKKRAQQQKESRRRFMRVKASLPPWLHFLCSPLRES